MKNESSMNDVFRFVQLKDAQIVSLQKTPLYGKFDNSNSHTHRVGLANELLAETSPIGILTGLDELEILPRIKSCLTELTSHSPGPKVKDLFECLCDVASIVATDDFQRDLELLSNTLLVLSLGSKNHHIALRDVQAYYLSHLLLKLATENPELLETSLAAFFRQRIHIPFYPTDFQGSVGVADLMVVEKHLLKYEAVEVAHIENVMSGETRTREHRSLNRLEETLIRETEISTEKEQELETAERFELNKEASRTIKEDHKFGADLTISGSYGPTIEFEAGAEYSYARTEESTVKQASTYAKDVMERSLERVSERVREERIRRIIKETEETNLHSFVNDSTDSVHTTGIYQFVDKVYRAQVFNYGKRQMFDLIIPEPSSFLHHLEEESEKSDLNLPDPPVSLDLNPLDLDYENTASPNFYTKFIERYSAVGISTPPDLKTVTFRHQQPDESDSSDGAVKFASEEHSYLAPMRTLEIGIPQGYVPAKAYFYALTFSDNGNDVRVDFMFDEAHGELKGTLMHEPGSSAPGPVRGLRWGHQVINFIDSNPWTELDGDNKLNLSFWVYESANHTITGRVECNPSTTLINEWKLDTYDKLSSAYQNKLHEYQDAMARIQADQKAQEGRNNNLIGVPPSKRKQIVLTELKRHAIDLLTQNHIHEPHWQNGNPVDNSTSEIPMIDIQKSFDQGAFIRFFEQAFEWNQLQFALYPYFWAEKESWPIRFKKSDPDYEFQQFLQAGAARVVFPVRPGFELTVAHFLETGEVWEGGDAPEIGNPLYVSIVQEIREQSGGRIGDPIPVGSAWDVRLPTNLVLLRQNASLPVWEEVPEGSWKWQPKSEIED